MSRRTDRCFPEIDAFIVFAIVFYYQRDRRLAEAVLELIAMEVIMILSG